MRYVLLFPLTRGKKATTITVGAQAIGIESSIKSDKHQNFGYAVANEISVLRTHRKFAE